MNERKYIEEIEGLMVEILYEYEEGDGGDYSTPPTAPQVNIIDWKLAEESREDYGDYSDEEWGEWMKDIDNYVYNDSYYDIVEFENDLSDGY